MENKRTLEMLAPGQSGIITSVSNESQSVKKRLVDMGLTPGTEVKVVKVAPFGDPLELKLRGYTLSIRKESAAQITIGELPPARTRKKAAKNYEPRQLDPEVLRRMLADHEHHLNAHEEPYDPNIHDTRPMKIALVGNPNSGKTTLFNALTGSNQYVGNWPGVTVEKKEGTATLSGHEMTIVDLPGIYSLSPYSIEEIVARNHIINEKPDCIINLVDATNIERNLYLTIQLLELERPMVVALNFMDEALKSGDRIDTARLSKELGIPVVPITAKTGEGLDMLLHTAHRQMHLGWTIEPDDLYDDFTHEIHHRVFELIHDKAHECGLPDHWASIKLLEGGNLVEEALGLSDEEKARLAEIVSDYESATTLGNRETLIADSRYGFIESVVSSSLVKSSGKDAESLSDKIDKVLTHRIFAVPIFLVTMLLVFLITFTTIGSWLSDLVSVFMEDGLSVWVNSGLESLGCAPWLISLVCDGIISGVGGVLTFLPQIALLFFFLALLEDSGYMARAAFIMDKLLRRFGLSGKAFIPMLMGFGCSVPAIMGARTMENEKDRRMTILLTPFMSCSAKLPVYALVASAFFGAKAGIIIFALYILGLAMAVASGLIFKNTLFKGEPAAFVMELPPYRMPSMRNCLLRLWEKVKDFLTRAGTIILVMSIILWFLQSFDPSLKMTEDMSVSILGTWGGKLAPIFAPLGFGMWQAVVALLTGFIAKEAVVASLSMFYGFSLTASHATVAAAMAGFTPLSAFSFLVFVLLYVPCVAAVSTIYREMNSAKWTLFSVCWQLGTAYVVTLIVFQLGRLLGLG